MPETSKGETSKTISRTLRASNREFALTFFEVMWWSRTTTSRGGVNVHPSLFHPNIRNIQASTSSWVFGSRLASFPERGASAATASKGGFPILLCWTTKAKKNLRECDFFCVIVGLGNYIAFPLRKRKARKKSPEFTCNCQSFPNIPFVKFLSGFA